MSSFKEGDLVRVVETYHDDPEWVTVGNEFRVCDVYPGDYYDVYIQGTDCREPLRSNQLEAVTESRVWKVEVPEEPAGVTRVRSVRNPENVYERDEDGLWSYEKGFIQSPWDRLVSSFPDGLELVPEGSDFEVSLDYLRRNSHLLHGLTESGVTGMHAAAVLREVIENG